MRPARPQWVPWTTPDRRWADNGRDSAYWMAPVDGAHRYREDFDGLARVEIVDPGNSFPSAASLVQLAHAQALREDYRQIDEIAPIYLRRPDAEINWTTRDSA